MFRISLLSISLIMILASAAVAPGLGEIAKAFPNENQTMIKLILSLPQVFIIPFSILAGVLSTLISKKKLLIIGLVVYIIGGIGAAFTDSMIPLLVFRAILGAGTGLILPLSTGLIADFYQGDERIKMLGFSFAANNLGSIIGNIGAGILALINWHYVFYIYLIGVVVLVLVIIFIRDIPDEKQSLNKNKSPIPASVYLWSTVMFFISFAFYAIVTNLSLVIYNRNIGNSSFAGMAFAANAFSMFCAGLSLKAVRNYLKSIFPGCMLLFMAVGYAGLAVSESKSTLIISVIIVGLGAGWVYPFIINKASEHAAIGRNTVIMAIVSGFAGVGQFSSPLILDTLCNLMDGTIASIFLALAMSMALCSFITLVGNIPSNLFNSKNS